MTKERSKNGSEQKKEKKNSIGSKYFSANLQTDFRTVKIETVNGAPLDKCVYHPPDPV